MQEFETHVSIALVYKIYLMKTRILYLFILAATAISSFVFLPKAIASEPLPTVAIKQNNSFTFFRIHRQGKGITATWAIAVNDGIVNFTIQRTYEDPTDPYAYWEDLNVVPFNQGKSFSFNDKNVYPGIINYRIVALKMDGTTETSEISAIRIVSRH